MQAQVLERSPDMAIRPGEDLTRYRPEIVAGKFGVSWLKCLTGHPVPERKRDSAAVHRRHKQLTHGTDSNAFSPGLQEVI